MKNLLPKKTLISVIGLGYVGLPLAIEFGKKFNVVGFDVDKNRINQLIKNIDFTEEIKKKDFIKSKKITFSSNIDDLKYSNFFIITVPTPINKFKNPDLSYLIKACRSVSKILKKNDIVILESTVYPGVTEEICVPIFEKISKLKFNKDFFCGYSPERINPGISNYKLTNIRKIVSGSNKLTLEKIHQLYSHIIKVGTYKVSSIRVAEAAKIIENCQRDVNVAFVNELSILFDKMKINTSEILKAASTKWNFLNFKPGLVGGHCIGVDPYYLTYKAKEIGYNSKIILTARKLNSQMSFFVVKKLINYLKINKMRINNLKILIMGFSFKENCKDVRNTGVIEIINNLNKYKNYIEVYDPIVDKRKCIKEYKIKLVNSPKNSQYDIIIIAVAHKVFQKMGIKKIRKFGKKKCLIFDIKSQFPKNKIDLTL